MRDKRPLVEYEAGVTLYYATLETEWENGRMAAGYFDLDGPAEQMFEV